MGGAGPAIWGAGHARCSAGFAREGAPWDAGRGQAQAEAPMAAAPRSVLLLSGKRKSGKDFVAEELRNRYRVGRDWWQG